MLFAYSVIKRVKQTAHNANYNNQSNLPTLVVDRKFEKISFVYTYAGHRDTLPEY
jgi:hypothetical protein